jgi:hypothetical protein
LLKNTTISVFFNEDPNFLNEINIEDLQANKSYIQLYKAYTKKIAKLEKETEKVTFFLTQLSCKILIS